MQWNWYYLIPIIFMVLGAIIYVAVFIINYKNSKNIAQAAKAAQEAITVFKEDNMYKVRNADGSFTVVNEAKSIPIVKSTTTEVKAEEVAETEAVQATAAEPVKTEAETKVDNFVNTLTEEQAKELYDILVGFTSVKK